MKKLVIPGRLPGLNEAFNAARTNKHIEAKTRHEYENLIVWSAKRCLNGWRPSGPVILHYTFFEPNKRRDKDNIAGYAMKLIQDSLVKAGYLRGDGWAYIDNFTFRWGIDKKMPRVEVEIEEVKDGT